MLKLKNILKDVITTNADDFTQTEVSEIVSDSRKLTKNCVFICIKGIKNDGHTFIEEAVKKGATAIVYTDENAKIPSGIVKIQVKNSRLALAKMWANASGHGERPLKIIAVTGTNGKTTVATMIYRALVQDGKNAALLGTLGGVFRGESISLETLTTPEPERLYPLLRHFSDAGAEYVVMEASSHALELNKLDGIEFEMGVFTNLTAEHLDFHGDMEGYFLAKARLFTRCKRGVFFKDNQYSHRASSYLREQDLVKFCSVRDENSDYFATDIVFDGSNGVSYQVVHSNEKFKIKCKIAGIFTVYNSLVAVGALLELGIKKESIIAAFAALDVVRGRMEKLPIDANFSVFIDFAHTPDALMKLLNSVEQFRKKEQRIVTLFGCGGDRDRSKRSLMGAIVSKLSDFVVVTSDNSRGEKPSDIIEEILKGLDPSCPYVRIDDRKNAIEYVIENALAGDIILLCGKGHEEYEITAKGTKPFSEREIVFETLKRFGGGKNDKN